MRQISHENFAQITKYWGSLLIIMIYWEVTFPVYVLIDNVVSKNKDIGVRLSSWHGMGNIW